MSTDSNFSGELRRVLLQPTRGVVGLVDDLLRVCQQYGLQLDWQAHRFRARSSGGDWEELIDVPLSKSAFRGMLARLAALCNERFPNSVSPYGGQGELLIEGYQPAVFRVTFANTLAEQKLELTTETGVTVEPSQRHQQFETTLMNDILIQMLGRELPSITDKAIYEVVVVEPGQYVTLRCSNRQKDSRLPWQDIAKVYNAACTGVEITPTVVDDILGNANWDSSTLCALVLAMRQQKCVVAR